MHHEYDTYAAIYDLQPTVHDDVPFYVELAKRAGAPVLELAVGTGRVALEVARAGVRVVGIDASLGMLQVLRDKLEADPELPVTAVHADMRTFDVRHEGPFSLAYCPFRGFLHLMTPADQLAALRQVAQHLRPAGLFAGNVFFPRVSLLNRYESEPQRWGQDGEFDVPDQGTRVIVSSTVRGDIRRQRIDVLFRYEHANRQGEVVKTELRDLSLTYLWPRELEHLLARAGFELEHLYGDFAGTPFNQGGDELVWVARKS